MAYGSRVPFAVFFACVLCTTDAPGIDSAREWQVYGGNPEGTRFSKLSEINPTNVSRLRPAWIYRCDDMRSDGATTIECNPLIIDGVIYLTTPGLKVVALNAASGT